MRVRGLIHLLSQELFGAGLALPEFPRIKSLRGLGTSDSESYSGRLADRLDYRNTFFHREPRFDIAHPADGESGCYDFVLSSEVLEHVVAPVEAALLNVFDMLKPSGVFVFTVPYSLEGQTIERFGKLHDFGFARLSDRTVLVNRTPQGDLQVFDDLIFHGGAGSTLEMREFSEAGLKSLLAAAGFTDVRIDCEDYPEFGIFRRYAWSLPIAARKGTFAFSRAATRDLAEQYRDLHQRLDALMRSLVMRIACKLRLL